jgi:hypothetical protein
MQAETMTNKKSLSVAQLHSTDSLPLSVGTAAAYALAITAHEHTMKEQGRDWVITSILLISASVGASATSAGSLEPTSSAWTPRRLADGQPDVRGFYKPTIEGTFSLVRPSRAPAIGQLEKIEQTKKAGGQLPTAKDSRITDPSDGQVPYQPWARAKQQEIQANMDKWTQPEHIDPQARCVPGGVTRAIFWSQLEVRQFPGYVVFVFDANHPYRVIPLDDRPHISPKVKLWMSDSRGHWQGNTLVIDVTNSNSKHRLSNEGDFASDQVHIIERYTFIDANHFKLQQRFEDPSVYTRPWTLSSDFYRDHSGEPDYEWWESECHEGERDVEHLYQGDKSKPY